MSVNPSGIYQPVSKVVTDGRGHIVDVVRCNCDDGFPGWMPSADCPVHGEDAVQLALMDADIEAHRSLA